MPLPHLTGDPSPPFSTGGRAAARPPAPAGRFVCNIKNNIKSNIKLTQSLGCRRKTIGRWHFPVLSALFSAFDSIKCQSDAIRGSPAGLDNLFGLHFHNGAFLLNRSPQSIRIYASEATRPNCGDTCTHSIMPKLLIAEL